MLVVRVLLATVFLVAVAPVSISFAGSCDHSWQHAKDGSRCGDRAADRREGGSDGYGGSE
jgi:hypothetical protein